MRLGTSDCRAANFFAHKIAVKACPLRYTLVTRCCRFYANVVVGWGHLVEGAVMTDEYTPTTGQVRGGYAKWIGDPAEFDRWLISVRLEAYKDGTADGYLDGVGDSQ